MVNPTHIPVLLEEAIQALGVGPGGRYIDATLGAGGHAEAILEHSLPGGQLLGIDADPAAIEISRTRLAKHHDSILLVNDNFANLEAICLEHDFFPVHGILFDLGLSSLQLATAERGFSFQQDAPLDMRFGPGQKVTAGDIVNTFSEEKLSGLLKNYGEERQHRKIARQIIKERPLKTTFELVRAVELAVGSRRGKRIHPATRTFQALRIAVNQELDNLETALKQAVNLLGIGGRLVVISYHSLEDRIVKRFMSQESRDCICPPGMPACICHHTACIRLLSRRAITPSAEEIKSNPRSRSAHLRAAERIVDKEGFRKTAEKLFFLADRAPEGLKRPVLIRQALRANSLS